MSLKHMVVDTELYTKCTRGVTQVSVMCKLNTSYTATKAVKPSLHKSRVDFGTLALFSERDYSSCTHRFKSTFLS